MNLTVFCPWIELSGKRQIFFFIKVLFDHWSRSFEQFFGVFYLVSEAPKFERRMYIHIVHCTMPRNNMNLYYSIRMYWTNFWQPTVHVLQNIFEKLLQKFLVHIFTLLFGTFCAQIGQLFEEQWVFKICLKINKSLSSTVDDLGQIFDLLSAWKFEILKCS